MKTDEVKKLVSDINKALEARPDTLDIDKVQKMIQDAAEAQKGNQRKGSWDSALIESLPKSHALLQKSNDPKMILFQNRCDDVFLTSIIMKRHPADLKIWRQFSTENSELRKAMQAGGAGVGLEWVPTEFSAELIDRIRLARRVPALFRVINMPSNPFKLPVVGADAVASLVPESATDAGPLNIIPATNVTSRNVTLTAVKQAAKIVFSTEFDEDSIIASMPLIKDQLVIALVDAMEKADIDGDTAGTHQDSDVTLSTDARKSWDGLRKLTQSGNKIDLSTFNFTNLSTVRLKMERYGVDPKKLAWIVSFAGYAQMRNLSEVTTLEKFGPAATILTGELAKLDGIPIIVSDFVRNDLNASGVFDGVTTNTTIAILAYRDAFIHGDTRKMTVKTWERIETDQILMVGTQRLDFQPLFANATEDIVAQAINIATTL